MMSDELRALATDADARLRLYQEQLRRCVVRSIGESRPSMKN